MIRTLKRVNKSNRSSVCSSLLSTWESSSQALLYSKMLLGLLDLASPLCALLSPQLPFFIGTPTYRVQLPSGSPLKSIIMVFVASFNKRKMEAPADSSLLF
jgi:hypothetical protein